MHRIVVTGMGAVTPLGSGVGRVWERLIAAIRALFGAEPRLCVSATKSAIGHLLGAAGGLGAIFATLALRDQVAPPTLNQTTPDPAAAGIDIVSGEARATAMELAMANGFGFGGVNASLLFRRWRDAAQ